MSYVSQTPAGRDSRRTVRANSSLLSEARKLSNDEIAFIRGREKKFHLNDDEIADFYFVKVVGEIQTQKSRMLAIVARKNFLRAMKKEPSREQVKHLQAALRTMNWDFEFIAGDDLEAARRVLENPLHDFTETQLKLILSDKATQKDLLDAGLGVTSAHSISQLRAGALPADPSPCCRAFVDTIPCAGCGLNVGYYRLEIDRAKHNAPTFPVAAENATAPERLFLY